MNHGLDTDERVCFYEQEFYVLGPEWDVSDAEEPLGIQLPDYDYQGGG